MSGPRSSWQGWTIPSSCARSWAGGAVGWARPPTSPSMMSPTIVLRDGVAQLAVGSAGSNRIRSAVLQTIIRSIDEGLEAQAAIDAPRVHFEDGMVYTEPGVDVAALEAAGRSVSPFRDRNLFFG